MRSSRALKTQQDPPPRRVEDMLARLRSIQLLAHERLQGREKIRAEAESLVRKP